MSKTRKASIPLQSQLSEPLIVVDESNIEVECAGYTGKTSDNESSSEGSPTNFMNPYLLSPWRDARETRKHSLPTPQCSGITASQVRRLSERGEGSPGPRQTEFLATLSTAPAPVPGGRRHSVVTISKVPVSLFGRSRRESVAAFPSPGRILPSRRESVTGPPSTEPRGSVHNLQLDIMDDIVQARKVRMKLWNTSSEKVCEVQPLDEAGGVQKYTSSAGRRYSDFVGTTLAPIPSSSKRRASELPPTTPTTCASTSASKHLSTGVVCSNTDLISILSSLTASATEINNQCEPSKQQKSSVQQKRSRLKTNRSNSFDVSILHDAKLPPSAQKAGPSDWFVKRHQPTSIVPECIPQVTVTVDAATEKKKNKVVWDGKSGSVVDAQILGNAIEDFLRRDSAAEAAVSVSPSKGAVPKTAKPPPSGRPAKSSWFSGRSDEDANEACDSSICSTLKDLFVK